MKCQLEDLGATEVLTEEELRLTNIFKSNNLKKPLLALNCVCGKNATEVQRHMDKNGVMVTYGGMSREPLVVPASSLIFKVCNNYWSKLLLFLIIMSFLNKIFFV